jgi:hypothetical protein
MTRLQWGLVADRVYESGVDRGVIYPRESAGVVWNGLTSVEETPVGADREELYFNGRKYLDLIAKRNYQASVAAFGYPKEFGVCIGERAVVAGFLLTGQQKLRFNFSYRTMINATAYKLHLVYNVLASRAERTHQSQTQDVSVSAYQWTFDAVPEPASIFPAFRPSAHYVVDSRRIAPATLSELEDILYGTPTTDPQMPIAAEINTLFGNLLEEPLTEPI